MVSVIIHKEKTFRKHFENLCFYSNIAKWGPKTNGKIFKSALRWILSIVLWSYGKMCCCFFKDCHTKQACILRLIFPSNICNIPLKKVSKILCSKNKKFPAWFLFTSTKFGNQFWNWREIQIKNRYVFLFDDLYAVGILAVHTICTESTAVVCFKRKLCLANGASSLVASCCAISQIINFGLIITFFWFSQKRSFRVVTL